MPAKDIFHEIFKRALVKDNWVITHDPYWIKLINSDINDSVDLVPKTLPQVSYYTKYSVICYS